MAETDEDPFHRGVPRGCTIQVSHPPSLCSPYTSLTSAVVKTRRGPDGTASREPRLLTPLRFPVGDRGPFDLIYGGLSQPQGTPRKRPSKRRNLRFLSPPHFGRRSHTTPVPSGVVGDVEGQAPCSVHVSQLGLTRPLGEDQGLVSSSGLTETDTFSTSGLVHVGRGETQTTRGRYDSTVGVAPRCRGVSPLRLGRSFSVKVRRCSGRYGGSCGGPSLRPRLLRPPDWPWTVTRVRCKERRRRGAAPRSLCTDLRVQSTTCHRSSRGDPTPTPTLEIGVIVVVLFVCPLHPRPLPLRVSAGPPSGGRGCVPP